MRTTLDFAAHHSGGNLYLRFINDEPAFQLLHSTTKRRLLVPKILLHIDFMRAELYPNDVGPEARGLGMVEFGGGLGPRIVSRTVAGQRSESYGLVFDVSSPYPLTGVDGDVTIKSHVLGSTMRNARIAFGEAYQQYLAHVQRDRTLGGLLLPRDPGYQVPVFEVKTWRRRTDERDGFGQSAGSSYIPNFELVGMVNHIDCPLTAQNMQDFARVASGQSVRTLDEIPDEGSSILPEHLDDIIPRRRPKLRHDETGDSN